MYLLGFLFKDWTPKCNLILSCISWYAFPKFSQMTNHGFCHILGLWKKLFKIYSQGDAFSQMQSNVITLAKIEKTLNRVLQNFELHFKFILFFPFNFSMPKRIGFWKIDCKSKLYWLLRFGGKNVKLLEKVQMDGHFC